MIDLLPSGPSVGCVDLFDLDPRHHRAHVGILIANCEDRMKGYASEALSLLKTYAFSHLNLHQLFCQIGDQNKRSISLFEKQGFTKSGTLKEWLMYDDEWHDVHTYQCIAPRDSNK